VVGIVSLVNTDTGVPVVVAPASQKEGEGERCGQRVAQRLLVENDLTGATVSFDALHGQAPARETAMSGGESLVQKPLAKGCLRFRGQDAQPQPRHRRDLRHRALRPAALQRADEIPEPQRLHGGRRQSCRRILTGHAIKMRPNEKTVDPLRVWRFSCWRNGWTLLPYWLFSMGWTFITGVDE
jgi:hypothetical protein